MVRESERETSGASGAEADHRFWIFGYGSLVWRPDFPYSEAVPAWAAGYVRRFWQASTDHRGVPGAPGRVATLVPEAGERCRGVVYRIDPEARERVIAYLDEREKNGYLRKSLTLELDDGRRVAAVTYIADPAGEHFLGDASMASIAAQIREARGPSGSNIDYVLRLATALQQLGAPRDDVFELERLLDGGSGT